MGNKKARTIKEYSAVALSTSDQTQNTENIIPLNDISEVDLELTVGGAGTPTSPQSILKAIKRFNIVDAQGTNVIDVAGTDLDKIYQVLTSLNYGGQRGHYVTIPTYTNANQTIAMTLPLPIKLENQPAKLQITLAPYSDLASGLTGGTVTLKVRTWYGAIQTGIRVYKKTVSIVSGDNSLGINLVNMKDTVAMALTVGTESNINNVSFSTDGQMDDYSKMPLQFFIDQEKQELVSGHTTGLVNLFVDRFVSNITMTRLDINAAGSDTVNVYQVALN